MSRTAASTALMMLARQHAPTNRFRQSTQSKLSDQLVFTTRYGR